MDQDGWNYEVRVEDGVVHTRFRGRMSPDATNKAIAASAEKAKTDDEKRVLFNFFDADFSKNYVLESMAQPTVARQLGIDAHFRIAFLSEKHFPNVQQMEAVARAQGYAASAFSTESEALAWLKTR
jgi:hypothetical protein